MGEVFRAVDTHAGSRVALKVLTSTAPGSDQRFRSEADVLRRLEHPGIVGMRSAGVHDGIPFLVLDLADGPTLAHELRAGRLDVDRTVDIGAQLAEALGHAHDRGIVHRDVKPSNILFDGERRARLADFGIARLADGPALTSTGELVGSAPYLAPEQVSGEDVGPPVDVYALGLVLAECLTGRPCFPGNDLGAAISRLHRPPPLPDDIPPWLDEALRATTARAPIRRLPVDAVAATLRSGGAVPVLASTARLGIVATNDPADDPDATKVAAPTSMQPVEDPERTLVAPAATGATPDRRPAAQHPRAPAGSRSARALTAVAVSLALIALVLLGTRGDGGSPDDPTADAVTITIATTATTAAPTTSPAAPAADEGPPPDAGNGPGTDGAGNGNGADGEDGNGHGTDDEGGNGHGNGDGDGEDAGRGNGHGH